jgi:hypothetical protein
LGCDSGASVVGDIGGRSFDLSTVYAWIDATDADLDPMAGKIVFTPADDKDLHLVLSGASYDPELDRRFMSAEELISIEHDQDRYGWIEMTVTESDSLANGAVLMQPAQGDGPSLDVNYGFGAVRLERDAVYPAEAGILASRVTRSLTLEQVERERGGYVTGTLVLAYERADEDPSSAQTGSIEVEFAAKLIGERIAECNRGQPAACELNPP